MPKSLSALLQEADDLIQTKTAGVSAKNATKLDPEDDVFKLAEAVRRSGDTTKEAAVEASDDELFTLTEKIAHAAAITDIYQNLPTLMKIASFENNAKAQGYSDAQISSYLEKNAAQFPMKSVLQG